MAPPAKQAVRDFNNNLGKFAKQLTASTDALRRTTQSKASIGRKHSASGLGFALWVVDSQRGVLFPAATHAREAFRDLLQRPAAETGSEISQLRQVSTENASLQVKVLLTALQDLAL